MADLVLESFSLIHQQFSFSCLSSIQTPDSVLRPSQVANTLPAQQRSFDPRTAGCLESSRPLAQDLGCTDKAPHKRLACVRLARHTRFESTRRLHSASRPIRR